jgi:hypothetical protein
MGLTCSPLPFGFPVLSDPPNPSFFHCPGGLPSKPRWPVSPVKIPLPSVKVPSALCRAVRTHPGPIILCPSRLFSAPNAPARLSHLSGTTRQNVSPLTTPRILTKPNKRWFGKFIGPGKHFTHNSALLMDVTPIFAITPTPVPIL